VTDLKMPGVDGMTVLQKARELYPETLVIVITAFGDLPTAVQAMKGGAFDFLAKPSDRDHLGMTIRRALEHARLRQEVRELRGKVGSEGKPFVFQSQQMTELVARADRVAKSDATVLIEGESGTGKELLARRIHEQSLRSKGPFVAVNCGAIPRELLESELFGHLKGAFTGATQDRKGRFLQAHGGTIFLDEIGDLPAELQTRLLRTLQERCIEPVGGDRPIPVDIRVLAATNQDLPARVKSGQFRPDLFYRLNVVPLSIPPLRERSNDVVPLAQYFLAHHSGKEWQIRQDAASRLSVMPWPGNVRELENLCHRLALLVDEPVLTKELLEDSEGNTRAVISPSAVELPREGVSLIELEKAILIKALEMNQYNQSMTAKFLRIPRHILLYRIEKFGIRIRSKSG